MPRLVVQSALAVVSVFAGLCLLAPEAGAHALLRVAAPAPGAVVASSPRTVELDFSEPVSLAVGRVEVYDPDGRRVQGAARASGSHVSVPFQFDRIGTYAVSWRVVGIDSHPVAGEFAFSVGAAGGSAGARLAQAASGSSGALGGAFGVARFAYMLATMLASGGIFYAMVVAPGWRPRGAVPALVVVFLASVAGFVLDAAIAGGTGVAAALQPDVLAAQARTLYGNAALTRIVLALLALVALSTVDADASRVARRACAAVALLLALTPSLASHAVGAGSLDARLPLDMAHVVAASLWLGGLVQLVLHVRSQPADARVAARRYSAVAIGCVGVLVASGAYAATVESGASLRALVTTTYGGIVVAKVALLLAVLPLAWTNRTRSVPTLQHDVAAGALALRRYATGELAVLLLVVALTSWLVQTPPARQAVGAAQATAGTLAARSTAP